MKKKKILRSDIQFAFFIIAVLVTVNQSMIEIGKGISWLSSGYIHYVCPVCGVTTIYQFFASSADFMTRLINPVTWVILASVLTAVFFGPIFCGWVCPFGAFQDFMSGLGKKIFKKRYNTFVSKKVENVLRWTRYISLLTVLYMVAKSMITVLESINPYHALLNLFVGEFAVIGLVVLAIVIITSLFIQRPWCKYLCPYGAFLGIFNSFRVKAVVREESSCVGCKKCDKTCPMNIEVSKTEVVRDNRCISCLECTSNNACPVENTVKLKGTKDKKETIKITAKNIIVCLIVIATLVTVTASITSSKVNAESMVDNDIDITMQLDGTYESGSFVGEGTGFNAGLEVLVTIDNNQITDIEIVNHNETIGYYESAFEAVPYEIISSQTTEVDAVSGATRSSEGIMEAVEDALSKALISESNSTAVVESVSEVDEDTESELDQIVVQDENQDQNQNQNRNQGGESDDEKVQEQEEIIVEVQGDYTDGVYIGTGTGYGGELTVEVTVENGNIQNVEVVENNETLAFLTKASALISDILKTQSTDVDTVSSATMSSEAIIEAVDQALKDAE